MDPTAEPRDDKRKRKLRFCDTKVRYEGRMDDAEKTEAAIPRESAGEVFAAFLRLGLTSFGGPVAHIGYFRDAFVVRRKWLTDAAYADLVALAQFLPGPASSQVGMALGLQRAGLLGLLAAWTAFTLPSAILLVAFAYGVTTINDVIGNTWIVGLKAAAVAVVAHAVLGMARTLAPDAPRATVAVGGMAITLLMPGVNGQLSVIVLGALAGFVLPQSATNEENGALTVPISRGLAIASLVLFFAILFGLPLLGSLTASPELTLFDRFYRAGALVFGGGHVVLPLLQAEVVETGLVSGGDFLAGYGAAQAVPGPLFTFAAYLGTVAQQSPSGLAGAAVALGAIFLPSALLIVGGLTFWSELRRSPLAQRLLRGVNAAVVGLLAAAFYNPVFTSGVTSPETMVLAAVSFVALVAWSAPAWAVVIGAGVFAAVLL